MNGTESSIIEKLVARVHADEPSRGLVCLPRGSARATFLARTASRIVARAQLRVLVVTKDSQAAARLADSLQEAGLNYAQLADRDDVLGEALARGLTAIVSTLAVTSRCEPDDIPDQAWVLLCDEVEKGFTGRQCWSLRERFQAAPCIGFTSSSPRSLAPTVRHVFGDLRDRDGVLVCDEIQPPLPTRPP